MDSHFSTRLRLERPCSDRYANSRRARSCVGTVLRCHLRRAARVRAFAQAWALFVRRMCHDRDRAPAARSDVAAGDRAGVSAADCAVMVLSVIALPRPRICFRRPPRWVVAVTLGVAVRGRGQGIVRHRPPGGRVRGHCGKRPECGRGRRVPVPPCAVRSTACRTANGWVDIQHPAGGVDHGLPEVVEFDIGAPAELRNRTVLGVLLGLLRALRRTPHAAIDHFR